MKCSVKGLSVIVNAKRIKNKSSFCLNNGDNSSDGSEYLKNGKLYGKVQENMKTLPSGKFYSDIKLFSFPRNR
jgi:hypothetical protein